MELDLKNEMLSSGISFWEMIRPPEDISTNGHLIENVFNYTTALNIFYFILVCAGLFGFSYFYHHRRHPRPYYTYGNKKIHLMVTAGIGLAVFFTIDLNITRMSNNDMVNTFWKWPDETKEEVLKVEVLAQQWMWHFRQAGVDGEFNSQDDIVTAHELVVPVDTKLMFQIVSKDVIHSFYVPNARIKVDAMPGRVSRIWMELTKEGTYDIACAEMCGTHHYLMQAKLIVKSKEDYESWKKEAHKLAMQTNDESYPESLWGWKWEN